MEKIDITQKVLEQALQNSRFTDEDHKAALCSRLFDEGTRADPLPDNTRELSMDELEMAAGGKQDPVERTWRKWT